MGLHRLSLRAVHDHGLRDRAGLVHGLTAWGTVVFALGIVLDMVIYYGGGRSRTQYPQA
jgi:hypothetical protein